MANSSFSFSKMFPKETCFKIWNKNKVSILHFILQQCDCVRFFTDSISRTAHLSCLFIILGVHKNVFHLSKLNWLHKQFKMSVFFK